MDFILGLVLWHKRGSRLCWAVDGRALWQLEVLPWGRAVSSLITLSLSGACETSAEEGGPALPLFRPRFALGRGLQRYQEGLWNLPELYMLWPFDYMEWVYGAGGLALCRS